MYNIKEDIFNIAHAFSLAKIFVVFIDTISLQN